MDLYLTSPVGPFPAAVGATFGTFTARQDVSPQPLPVILPNQLRIGTKIMIMAEGEFSTTATPTLTMGFYIGTQAGVFTTAIAESSAITTASGAAAFPWRMEWRGLVTGVGASGTLVGSGAFEIGTALTTSNATPIPITQALRTVAIDCTIARAVGVCATWSVSSASNTVKTINHAVMLLN
jgi:hypothetical protein